MPSPFPDGELDTSVELGAVDSSSVRVWARQPHTGELPLTLEVEGQPAIQDKLSLSADTDWTGAITLRLPAPAPGAPFVCRAGAIERRGRLAPAPESHSRVVFGLGSCNRPFEVAGGDALKKSAVAALYPAMAADLARRRADFLLLAGDQVYSDELAPISVRDGLSGDAGHPAPFDEALAAYRRVARGYLGERGFLHLRQSLPTYCIWDDHDIFNCWGSRLKKTPQDRRMFEAAARTYAEYQHQRSPEGALSPPPFTYHFRYGNVGFLVLDLRGARDWEQGTLLGAEQWAAVQAYLTSPDAATLHTLFVVASIPVAHVSRWVTRLFDRIPGENGNLVRDRWCSAAFVKSRDALLRTLFTWQTSGRYRQVVILSGDVHCASAFAIRPRRGKGVIQQFTSSAMTTPDPLSARVLNRVVTLGSNLSEPDFHFSGRLLTFRNNFGIVSAEPLPHGGHRVTFRVRAWQSRQKRLVTAGRVVSIPEDSGKR